MNSDPMNDLGRILAALEGDNRCTLQRYAKHAAAALRAYASAAPSQSAAAPAITWDALAKAGRIDRLPFKVPGKLRSEQVECVILTREDVQRLAQPHPLPGWRIAMRATIEVGVTPVPRPAPWVDPDSGEQRVTPRPPPHKQPPAFAVKKSKLD